MTMKQNILNHQKDILLYFAQKYIWWKPPKEAILIPNRIIAQVMNIGSYDDVRILFNNFEEDLLREILHHAEAGQFTPRSWTYWHYCLNLCNTEQVPPLPVRKIKSSI